MRMDKLTSRFQQALADAQSLAVGRDHNLIEPAHLLTALLDQQGGSTRPLLAQAGVNVPLLRERLAEILEKLPKVSGQAGNVSLGNDLGRLLNVADKLAQQRGDAYIASEWFVLAALDDGGDAGRALKAAGADQAEDRSGHRKNAGRRDRAKRKCRRAAPGVGEVHDRPDRARGIGQARSGGRPRRGNPPHDPGAATAHQEQSGADRRTRRRQDRDRRRSGAAHRQRRSARRPAQTSACCRWTWAR